MPALPTRCPRPQPARSPGAALSAWLLGVSFAAAACSDGADERVAAEEAASASGEAAPAAEGSAPPEAPLEPPVGATGGGSAAADEEAADGAAPAGPDVHGPRFDGVASVALAGLDRFTLSWTPAEDDRTPADRIVYRTYHVVEPYRELTDATEAIHTSPPGVTSVTIAHDAPAGRFYVRAVDEAGNLSPITSGLLQRPERPRVSAVDGTAAARITACEPLGTGMICVGRQGFAAHWTGTGWRHIELGVLADFRLASTPSGLFAYSDAGHLYQVGEDGDVSLIDLVFLRRTPTLPLRSFVGDTLGLRYWIDAEGRVFVGADRAFMSMPRPLALPGNECRSVRGLAFGPTASFAICAEGLAYSADPRARGVNWASLTPNADFALPAGVAGVIATDDTEGIVHDPTGIRRVAVGGWHPLLLVNWRQPGVHPMDIPETPPPITRIGQVFMEGDRLRAVTDAGLLERDGADWRVLPGTDGALAGVHNDGQPETMTLVYEDGSVARWQRGTRTWLIQPSLGGFDAAFATRDGALLATRPSGELLRWTSPSWQRIGAISSTPSRLVGASTATYVLGAAPGALSRLDAGGLTAASFLYPPPPRPAPRGGAPAEFAAPPPLSGVPASQTRGDIPAPGVFVGIDVADDGRAVAVTDTQVWWRVANGWRYLHTMAGPIEAVWLDAGDTYVVLERGRAVRCWRDTCGDPVAAPEGADRVVRAAWEADRALGVDAAGEQLRFVAATAADASSYFDPATETPAGRFEALPALGRYATVTTRRLRTDRFDVVATIDGEIYELLGDRWELQAEAPGLLALADLGERWGFVTGDGLFVLGDVEPVTRSAE